MKSKKRVPMRPPKTITSRRPNPSESELEGDSIPHVVRVTILGVAGLLANPIHADKKTQSTASVASCTSSVAHPSLLFPLPSNLRVVASVSRSQAARGIPSGMSKALFSIDDSQSEMIRNNSWGGDSFEERPESYVAMWDKIGKQVQKKMAATSSSTHKFVNLTNSLAFEAELRPTPTLEKSSTTDGPASQSAQSKTYAPKSFCVSIGLVPDDDACNSANQFLDPADDRISDSNGSNKTLIPPFAIPIGFANLVVNGNETLNGQQKQIDLPLTSISDFLEMLEVESAEDGLFPLIELTSETLESKNNAEKTTSTTEATSKPKKKSIVKRIFARKQQPSTEESSTSQSQSVYSGTPRSIFELERPPNAKERALFLDRYTCDRDAIVRIGLEVFPRGSELEQVFRQQKKSRKMSQACSLMDDIDEETMLQSNDMSSFGSTYFTLRTDDDQWENATMYTEALSSVTHSTIEDDFTLNAPSYAESYLTDGVASKRSSRSVEQSSLGKMLSQFMNCNATDTCGIDEGIDPDQSCRMAVSY